VTVRVWQPRSRDSPETQTEHPPSKRLRLGLGDSESESADRLRPQARAGRHLVAAALDDAAGAALGPARLAGAAEAAEQCSRRPAWSGPPCTSASTRSGPAARCRRAGVLRGGRALQCRAGADGGAGVRRVGGGAAGLRRRLRGRARRRPRVRQLRLKACTDGPLSLSGLAGRRDGSTVALRASDRDPGPAGRGLGPRVARSDR
jgi:hypothetical protein